MAKNYTGVQPKKKRNRMTKKYKGVQPRSYGANGGVFGARIWDRKNRQSVWLGIFKTQIEAARAYDKAAVVYKGTKAKLNFPLEVHDANTGPSSANGSGDSPPAGDALIQLYHSFITDFETKINLLKLAHFAVIVSRQYSEKLAAISYLEEVIEKLRATKETRIEEPILYIKMQIAIFNLEKGDHKECKNLLEAGKSTLDSMTDIDPSVYANYYWVSSQYHKSRQEFAEFYKNSLLYLAYTSVDALSDSFKLDLAFDLSLSALLGDNIYNFGELLAHPIIKSLLGTKVEWLYHILEAFNAGDLVRYQELCRVHAASLNAQPALVENEKKLLEKINILCLMEIIFRRPSEDRTIPLSIIAEQTKLTVENVESLLMKSLSVHLIEGIIDQVEGTVYVSWVQPRVLGISQIKALCDRLDSWVGKVHTALVSVEAETPDLVAS